MSRPKTIQPIITKDGNPETTGVSTPKWFIDSKELLVDGYEKISGGEALPDWGPLFSEPKKGNTVEFLTTGESYFENVATAISGAKQSVFIAGWQINYDVQLTGSTTLFDCLLSAIKNGATLYVMPWMAPPGPVKTGYLGTLLAVYHLNAHPEAKGKAYCLPAMAQSDQGTAAIAFSHHQKSVIIDNKIAYVGGIDLAYGRRDDANFSLKAGWRGLSEIYSSCIPAIHKTRNVELVDCVTTAELLSASFTRGASRSVATFATSPSDFWARPIDALNETSDQISDAKAAAGEFLDRINLVGHIADRISSAVQDVTVDAAQGAARWAWSNLGEETRERLKKVIRTQSGNAANVATALFAWLNGADLSLLPHDLLEEINPAINALVFGVVASMYEATTEKPEYYERLFEKIRMVPSGGMVVDSKVQPRMPWEDVQCRVEGPSVYDVSRNFALRWNGIARKFEKSFRDYRDPAADFIFKHLGMTIPNTPKAPRIGAEHMPKSGVNAPSGSSWVQVLRSASRQMLRDELDGARDKTGVEQRSGLPQNNCLKGIVQVIGAAQHFIYIEGQFFQSAHGASGPVDARSSGPMGAMTDITRNPNHAKFAEMLGIAGLSDPLQIAERLRWSKIDDVIREAQGAEYKNDVLTVLMNQATIKAMRAMGNPQSKLINPIGQAIVSRIERVIIDELPFHVYIVVPVHPEGTLNTLNIMSQIHLTMHSLVFGHNSLVNGVRRAILAERFHKEKKLTRQAARAQVAALDLRDLADAVGDGWKEYLTLLNLRNWDTIGGRPVTEQIYVHSKLVIADDRVAVLGSANINDRSQLGDRDSEIAVIVNDDAKVKVKLDGKNAVDCGKAIHTLRRALWEKHFGLKSANRKAASLESVLDQPAAPATWKAIQKVAFDNAEAYEKSFWYIPRSAPRPEIQLKEKVDPEKAPPPASVWPTWHYATYLQHGQGGELRYRMPFDPLFWREAERGDTPNAWNVGKDAARARAPENTPKAGDIQGFIVELPTRWTYREDNLMIKTHISALAQNTPEAPDGKRDSENAWASAAPIATPTEASA
jgi:phospholipase D1/2